MIKILLDKTDKLWYRSIFSYDDENNIFILSANSKLWAIRWYKPIIYTSIDYEKLDDENLMKMEFEYYLNYYKTKWEMFFKK